ncbi:MAG: hypothetical protein US49_C0002G0124 [candidate division TM6 bacterium GW2011_GWF2_37_49]|nr:MAG: hypothetical protein US49_C0002G0124 [candidate division TM6 bacterium GW2011_GWF2_37_49]
MKTKKAESLISKDDVLTFLRENKAFLEREFGVTRLALFGSYARNEQNLSSDIDILIDVKTHDFRNRMRLKHFLENALNKRIDLIYFDSLRLIVKKSIQEDLIYA